MTSGPTRFRLRCELGFHAWNMWSEPKIVPFTMKAYQSSIGGGWITLPEPVQITQVLQVRICQACGIVERREVKT